MFYLQAVSLDGAGFGAILTYIPAICLLLLAVSTGQVLMVHLFSWQPPPPPLVSSILPLPVSPSQVTGNHLLLSTAQSQVLAFY